MNPDKPPFIASQQLYLLDPEVDDPRPFLKPGLFRRPEKSPDGPHERDSVDGPWKRISREQMIIGLSRQHVCLSTDAGQGKTTTLEWAEQEFGRQAPESLALLLEMRQLPDTGKPHLHRAPDGSPPVLAETFKVRGG